MSASNLPVDRNLYGYTPTRSVCYVFVVLFVITSALHLFQATRSRAWWLFPTVIIATLAEVIGWIARTKGSYDPMVRITFIIQTTVLVLAPTPFVAALFVGFGRITDRLGSEYSRLKPSFYSRVFLTSDIVSLMVQGAGGGMAASANDPDKIRLGSDIILGGLIIQITSMTIFCFLMAEYAWRRAGDRPYHKIASESAEQVPMDRHVKILIAGICLATAFTYIRCIFRVIEFADGFDGTIAHTEVLFNVFDGMMMTLAMYTLNFMDPGRRLRAMAQPPTPGYAMGRMASP